jgi:hypothetical protein
LPASHRGGRVRVQLRSSGIYGGQIGTAIGLLRVLRFLLLILIPPTAPHTPSIIRGWYNRPVCGRRTKWTPSHPNMTNKIIHARSSPMSLSKNCISASPVLSPCQDCVFESHSKYIFLFVTLCCSALRSNSKAGVDRHCRVL